MDIWTLLNPILKLGFYLSVVGTVGTALFFFHFKKILEKQNVEFCKNLMFFSSGFGLIICLLFFISLAGNFGGNFTSIFNIMFLKLAFKTTVGQVALLTAFAHAVICVIIFGVNLITKVILVFCTTGIILSFAIVGHSSTKGYLAQFLLLIHLIGISYWIGSFIPLCQLCKSSNYNVISNVGNNMPGYAGDDGKEEKGIILDTLTSEDGIKSQLRRYAQNMHKTNQNLYYIRNGNPSFAGSVGTFDATWNL